MPEQIGTALETPQCGTYEPLNRWHRFNGFSVARKYSVFCTFGWVNKSLKTGHCPIRNRHPFGTELPKD